jgi:formate-dependent phosphoribosylglycinamide formyltransferase (GAR transformylase)
VTRTVLFLSPGYPSEMPLFVRGLATAGARVIGAGDQPVHALPDVARDNLASYWQVPGLDDEEGIIAEVRRRAGDERVDQVESLWEPAMLLAARLRASLGLAGMTMHDTLPFRDKERMKQVLDAAGIRTPHHGSAVSADGVRRVAERIGFPVVVKPIAGAGSASTYRVDSAAALEEILPQLLRVHEVSVEEFVDGEEFTFDTICADGDVLFENIGWYSPRPLVARSLEWVSPITFSLRDIGADHLSGGRAMGHAVLRALGFQTGFAHMEWYRRPDGEVVFGEIGARPPGARTVDVMNYACDSDLFAQWAEAVLHGGLSLPVEHLYNAATVCKRARGQGRITRIDGLSRLLTEFEEAVVSVDLLPLGAPRRDWRRTLLSDGTVTVRHRDLGRCIEIADRFASDLHLYAS